jgi:hypothetical protein
MEPPSDPDPTNFLNASLTDPGRDDFRQAVFAQCAGVMRRRRWNRRLVRGATLAACYLAGILTMRVALPPALVEPVTSLGQSSKGMPQAEKPTKDPGPSDSHAAPPSAFIQEWQAFESQKNRQQLLRAAGDRYVEEADLVSAVRCYRNSLDSDGEKDLAISADDNWLLMALKGARQKERNHATSDG